MTHYFLQLENQTSSLDQFPEVKPKKRRWWPWILGGSVLFILILSWMNRDGELTEIPQARFENMVEREHIRKLVLVKNTETVEITLTPQALKNVVYRQELDQANAPFQVDPNEPHYLLRLASIEKFYRDYERLTAEIPPAQKVDVLVEERNDVTQLLLNWLFLFVLIFGMVRLAMFIISKMKRS